MKFIPILLLIISATAFSQNGTNSDQKVTTALVTLKAGNGVNEGESEIISDRLRSELFKTAKVTIMERDQMQEILKEQGFQQSGACTDEACLVEMGQMLGVKHMVVGSLGKLGSMFMVNVRSIDVQTSKVINVVSVDVKGEIEDLVNKLPYIANQLVSEPETEVAVQEQTPLPEQPSEPQEELKPEVPATTTVEAPVDPVEKTEVKKLVIKEIGKNKYKNENRFGVSFVMEIGGAPQHEISQDTITDDGVAVIDSAGHLRKYYSENQYDHEQLSLINLQVRFQLKMGPFLNMAIAPGFMFSTETYSLKDAPDGVVDQLKINYAVPMIHLGLAYVKRIYPIKINAGAFVNFTMPVTTYTNTIYGVDLYDNIIDDSRDDSDIDFILAPGLRAGTEFLMGAHFSFGAEGVWTYWPEYETKFNFDELGLEGFDTPDATQEIKFPPLKVGFNFNIYF
ncbi:MAG TPA: CsgG/HfaB family protein [Chitinispirillaceae bacterium]|nr:CsgG/HfaB family protein [Chitinispirillaceae bacterium]